MSIFLENNLVYKINLFIFASLFEHKGCELSLLQGRGEHRSVMLTKLLTN